MTRTQKPPPLRTGRGRVGRGWVESGLADAIEITGFHFALGLSNGPFHVARIDRAPPAFRQSVIHVAASQAEKAVNLFAGNQHAVSGCGEHVVAEFSVVHVRLSVPCSDNPNLAPTIHPVNTESGYLRLFWGGRRINPHRLFVPINAPLKPVRNVGGYPISGALPVFHRVNRPADHSREAGERPAEAVEGGAEGHARPISFSYERTHSSAVGASLLAQ